MDIMGENLSIVAQNVNNQFYVIAYVVIHVETTDNRKWFLALLETHIGHHVIYG